MDDYMFGNVDLSLTEDIVRYSFLFQKSLTPLDLSTLELSCLTPTPCTEESFQKLFGGENRRVLFEYHLDVSHGLENALKEHDRDLEYGISDKFETSIYRGAKIAEDYDYLSDIYPYIKEAIENSSNRMARLKKFFPLMKIIRNSSGHLEDYWYRDFSRILQEECTDSELVAEFIVVCDKQDFIDFLLNNNEKIEHMEYFLHHSQKMRIGMQFEGVFPCPVSGCLFRGKYQRAIALIKYGKMRQPLNEEDVEFHLDEFSGYGRPAIRKWIKWNPRYSKEPELCLENLGGFRRWHFLLLISVFFHLMMLKPTAFLIYDLGIQALRLMWRSLPDAYLTLSEIQSVWIPDIDLNPYQPTAKHVYTLYKTKIIDCRNKGLEEEGPRSLQHLARCAIRGRLAANCALPDGVQFLGLPNSIQGFLSLES